MKGDLNLSQSADRTKISFDWVEIPAGEFLMGSNPVEPITSYPDESPQHQIDMEDFFISAKPITNSQYEKFVNSTGHKKPGHWIGGVVPPQKKEHPVTYIDWEDANAFAIWCGATLPSEAQWEKSARGNDGRLFPWGDEEPTKEHANFGNSIGDTTEVGIHKSGASMFGVLDLAGNVWEWTSSIYKDYPYNSNDGRENVNTWGARVVRGGNYLNAAKNIRCADRHSIYPTARDIYIGFRVATKNLSLVNRDCEIDFEWREIPAGKFLMGSEHTQSGKELPDPEYFGVSKHGLNRPADFDNEIPQHKLLLEKYKISKTPVTNLQYENFTKATNYPVPGHWPEGVVTNEIANHPVVYVDWADVQAFCTWAGVALPTEPQWERAARGRDGRIWPWGNFPPTKELAIYGQADKTGRTKPVGSYPAGASPEGLLDVAGNVWEMVGSAYRPYPYNGLDGREKLDLPEEYVLRGGSFYSPHGRYLRTTARSMNYQFRRRDHIGFRVVLNG
jgi:formylglycine-generating enzyme required for sulfatase activity